MPEQMVDWFELAHHDFLISWRALQCFGISRFVELFDPCKDYVDLNQALSNALRGCVPTLREWAKSEKSKRSQTGEEESGVWESFVELQPKHIDMESKIRYARRFWSRLFKIQCLSVKALTVFELASIPADYSSTSALISFLFSEKMPSLLSRIRNNITFREVKPVYRDLHLFDVVLLWDLMIVNGVRIPVREGDVPSRRSSSRVFFRQ